jgi:hypothetical protein
VNKWGTQGKRERPLRCTSRQTAQLEAAAWLTRSAFLAGTLTETYAILDGKHVNLHHFYA